MKKKNDPFFNESPYPSLTLHPFSNNRELSEVEWFALRSRLATAEMARDHLIANDLIPVFDSFDFEGMFLKGGQK